MALIGFRFEFFEARMWLPTSPFAPLHAGAVGTLKLLRNLDGGGRPGAGPPALVSVVDAAAQVDLLVECGGC